MASSKTKSDKGLLGSSLLPSAGLLAQGMNQGPYGPMGAGINIGVAPDLSRPKLDNPDGTFSTEETITLPLNGVWYNVPTIVDGVRYKPEDIEQYFTMGLLPHVGEFPTEDMAVRSARVRTQQLGKIRETDN